MFEYMHTDMYIFDVTQIIEIEAYSELCKTSKMDHFAKIVSC